MTNSLWEKLPLATKNVEEHTLLSNMADHIFELQRNI